MRDPWIEGENPKFAFEFPRGRTVDRLPAERSPVSSWDRFLERIYQLNGKIASTTKQICWTRMAFHFCVHSINAMKFTQSVAFFLDNCGQWIQIRLWNIEKYVRILLCSGRVRDEIVRNMVDVWSVREFAKEKDWFFILTSLQIFIHYSVCIPLHTCKIRLFNNCLLQTSDDLQNHSIIMYYRQQLNKQFMWKKCIFTLCVLFSSSLSLHSRSIRLQSHSRNQNIAVMKQCRSCLNRIEFVIELLFYLLLSPECTMESGEGEREMKVIRGDEWERHGDGTILIPHRLLSISKKNYSIWVDPANPVVTSVFIIYFWNCVGTSPYIGNK